MRLGLKPQMREKNSTRVQIPYELSHVPSHFSRDEHSFGNLTALMHPTDNLRYESHRIIESLGNLLHACMNSSFCMPVLHSDCSHAWNSHSDHSECAGQLLYRDFRGFVGRHPKQRSCSPRGAPRAPQTGTQHVCSTMGVGACERGGQDKERVRGVGANTTRRIPIQMYDIQIHTNAAAGYGYTAVWV
jgi:hypothetical protein